MSHVMHLILSRHPFIILKVMKDLPHCSDIWAFKFCRDASSSQFLDFVGATSLQSDSSEHIVSQPSSQVGRFSSFILHSATASLSRDIFQPQSNFLIQIGDSFLMPGLCGPAILALAWQIGLCTAACIFCTGLVARCRRKLLRLL